MTTGLCDAPHSDTNAADLKVKRAVLTPQHKALSSPTSTSTIKFWLSQIPDIAAVVSLQKETEGKRKRKRLLSSSGSTHESDIHSTSDMLQGAHQAFATPSRSSISREPQTPSTPSQQWRPPNDAGWIGRRMEQHGLMRSGRETLNRFPELKSKIAQILDSDRNSTMKPGSVKRITDRLDDNFDDNEDSILFNCLPLIIKSDFTKEKPMNDQDQGVDGPSTEVEREYRLQDWFEEGVTIKVDREFRKGLLPTTYKDDELESFLAKSLRKTDGMTNPKPDFCYGLRRHHLDIDEQRGVRSDAEITYLLEACPGMHHAFFIIEGKSNGGIIGEAENQLRRGGATLVNVGRKLQRLTAVDSAENPPRGADIETIVFSATMTPQTMEIFVHWAEDLSHDIPHEEAPATPSTGDPTGSSKTDKRTLYHMTWLKAFSLRDQDSLPQLRAYLHNILDWGCNGRAAYLQKLRRDLYERARQESARCSKHTHAKPGRANKRQRLISDQDAL